MATVHAGQALFLAKQIVPCTVELKFLLYRASSTHLSVHDYVCPSIGALKHGTLNLIANELQLTKLFYCPSFLLYSIQVG